MSNPLLGADLIPSLAVYHPWKSASFFHVLAFVAANNTCYSVYLATKYNFVHQYSALC